MPAIAPVATLTSNFLQNGLGNEAVIDEELGRGFVVAGRTFVGGDAIAPGEIVAGLRGKHTVIGELEGVVIYGIHVSGVPANQTDLRTGAGQRTAKNTSKRSCTQYGNFHRTPPGVWTDCFFQQS